MEQERRTPFKAGTDSDSEQEHSPDFRDRKPMKLESDDDSDKSFNINQSRGSAESDKMVSERPYSDSERSLKAGSEKKGLLDEEDEDEFGVNDKYFNFN